MDTTRTLQGNVAGSAFRMSRRGFLRSSAATGLAAAAAYTVSLTGVAAGPRGNVTANINERNNAMTSTNNVVLVHGAWADASSWSRVIPLLQQAGYHVSAVQLSLASLADDVAVTRRAIDAIPGPVTLVGHSYGGAVISGAGNAPNVTSLVYVAAFAPDEDETLGEVLMRFPPLASGQDLRPDAAGYVSVDPTAFPQDFAADVDPVQAGVMAVVQRPISGAIFGEKAGRRHGGSCRRSIRCRKTTE